MCVSMLSTPYHIPCACIFHLTRGNEDILIDWLIDNSNCVPFVLLPTSYFRRKYTITIMFTTLLKQQLNGDKWDVGYYKSAFGWAVSLCCFDVKCFKECWHDNDVWRKCSRKLQSPVYDILPPTSAITGYAIALRKLSTVWLFFTGAHVAVRL